MGFELSMRVLVLDRSSSSYSVRMDLNLHDLWVFSALELSNSVCLKNALCF